MADSNFKGPVNSMGAIDTGTPGPIDGPSMFYQGWALPDPRATPFAKDGFRPGQQDAFQSSGNLFAVDGFPQAASTTLLGPAQLVTAALAMTMSTTQTAGVAGTQTRASGVRILPLGTTTYTTALFALDFGFATGTTVAASTSVVVNDASKFKVGQWIIIGGAGNAAATLSHIAQVQSVNLTTNTAITIAPAAVTAIANAPIGAGNLFGGDFVALGTQYGPTTAAATSHVPAMQAGLARIANPAELISRNVSVTVGTTTATTSFLVVGYDVWRQPMTELIGPVIATNRAFTTFFGSKAFKYVQSVTPTVTAVGTASVGVGDTFGLPYRADDFSQGTFFWNGCAPTTKLGFTAAATTAPATNTTGDVRGTLQASTNGTGTAMTIATAAVSNGTARLTIIQSIAPWNQINATPTNLTPLFGVTNSTT